MHWIIRGSAAGDRPDFGPGVEKSPTPRESRAPQSIWDWSKMLHARITKMIYALAIKWVKL
jgi:hypothetical protein